MAYLGRKGSQHLQPWLRCNQGYGNKTEKVFWELSESFWVLSTQINRVRESHQPVPPSHHFPGSFSISQLQIRVWPSASSARLFPLHQYKVARGHPPWGSSHAWQTEDMSGRHRSQGDSKRTVSQRSPRGVNPEEKGPCLDIWDHVAVSSRKATT